MEIKIVEEKTNPLLGRRELEVNIVHDGPTPTRADVISKLKAVTGAKKDTVVVKSFHSKFGARESRGIVRIYDSKERAMEIEPEFMLEKNQIGKEEEKPKEKGVEKEKKKVEKKEVKGGEKVAEKKK